jgi:alkylation response protein AidB-like acyl-CoA dehydrogenase
MNTACPVEMAKSLYPLISEKRREGELRARLAPEVVEAVGRAGMFRLFAPVEVGGLEVTPRQAFLATAEIAAADPAVSWYMVNSIPACMAAAVVPDAERRALFAEPDRNFGFSAVALATARAAPGGYRLSGSWPVVTGCEDSRWCARMSPVVDDDGPPPLSYKKLTLPTNKEV